MAVQRAVRQRDGFGCIICGKAIYDYEHFDPEFADATEHNPGGIVLLCIEHHGLKTRGLLSKSTIRGKIMFPKCKEAGFSFGPFDIGTMHPEIVLGRLRCTNVQTLIMLDDESILSVLAPISPGLPFRINASLRDADGRPVLEIVENEWRTPIDNWDVVVSGPKITIRRGLGEIDLVIRSEPPDRIVIERLDMSHRGTRISCREGQDLEIVTRSGQVLRASGITIDGCRSAIAVRNNGLSIGVGGGSTYIENMSFSNNRIFPIDCGFIGAPVLDKPRRLALCHCGSGLRYKHCHGKF